MNRFPYILMFASFMICSNSFGQGILKQMKLKATEVAEKIIDKKTDEILDHSRESRSEKNQNEQVTKISNRNTNAKQEAVFEPGTKLVWREDFNQEELGEFPMQWYTNSKGTVVQLENLEKNWLQLFPGKFLSPNFNFQENYSIEFDVFMNYPEEGNYPLPFIKFGIFDRGLKNAILSNSFSPNNVLDFTFSPYRDKMHVRLLSLENKSEKILTDNYVLPDFYAKTNKPIHFSIDVQKERVRLWIDSDLVFNLPVAVPNTANFNQIRIEMESSAYHKNELGYYISNIQIHDREENLRTKFLKDNSLVSNAILFASNSAEILSDSQGIIKGMADLLKTNNSIQIKIVGHTDQDGSSKHNLQLSEKRAEAVKSILVEVFGISADRIATEGKGADQPIVQNDSEINKEKNRRVEFIKIN